MEARVVEQNGEPLVRIEKPTPSPTGTEVLVEVTYCVVCHSDLHFWEGLGRQVRPGRRLPRAMQVRTGQSVPEPAQPCFDYAMAKSPAAWC